MCRNTHSTRWEQWGLSQHSFPIVCVRSRGSKKPRTGLSEVRYRGVFIALSLNDVLTFRKLPFIKCLLYIFYCGISKLQKGKTLPTVPIMFLFVCFLFLMLWRKDPDKDPRLHLAVGCGHAGWFLRGVWSALGVSAWAGVRPQVTCGWGYIDSHRRTLVSTSEHLGGGSEAGLGRLANF